MIEIVKSELIQVRIEKKLKERIELLCKKEGIHKSEFLMICCKIFEGSYEPSLMKDIVMKWIIDEIKNGRRNRT